MLGALLAHGDIVTASALHEVGTLRLLCDAYATSHAAHWDAGAHWQLRKAAIMLASICAGLSWFCVPCAVSCSAAESLISATSQPRTAAQAARSLWPPVA